MAELIIAFDMPSGRDALLLAARLPGLKWAKLGPVLFVREGPTLIKEFRQRGIQVFLDFKWHDIPNIVATAVTAARELGVSMATVHCLGGRTMLGAAARAAGEDLALVGVTVLTSHDAAELESVLGRGVPDVGFEAERLARAAMQAGLRGVVASGQELGLLREALGPKPWIVVPGIRGNGEPARLPAWWAGRSRGLPIRPRHIANLSKRSVEGITEPCYTPGKSQRSAA